MLSVPTDTNEILILGTSFVSILHGKTKINRLNLYERGCWAFGGSEKGQSLISAYRTLAITMNTTIYGAERGSIHMFDDVEAGVKKSHH